MQRLSAIVSAAAIVASATAVAQPRPNFAGRWTVDPPPTPPVRIDAGDNDEGGRGRGGRAGRGGWGGPNGTITFTQDASKLTVAYPQGPNNVTVIYDVTGAETKNTVPGNFGPVEQTSRAAWRADTLVITTGEQTRSVSIHNEKLVVETRTSGAVTGTAATDRATYTRAPDAPGRGRGRGGRGAEGSGAGDPD